MEIRLFSANVNGLDYAYLLTTDGSEPISGEYKILSAGYVRHQVRKELGYMARSGDYEEVDLLLSSFRNMSVKEILKKAK